MYILMELVFVFSPGRINCCFFRPIACINYRSPTYVYNVRMLLLGVGLGRVLR